MLIRALDGSARVSRPRFARRSVCLNHAMINTSGLKCMDCVFGVKEDLPNW